MIVWTGHRLVQYSRLGREKGVARTEKRGVARTGKRGMALDWERGVARAGERVLK